MPQLFQNIIPAKGHKKLFSLDRTIRNCETWGKSVVSSVVLLINILFLSQPARAWILNSELLRLLAVILILPKSLLPGLNQFLGAKSPLKLMKNECFFFRLKSSFHSKDIQVMKNGLNKKLSLISKFMMSSIGKIIITIRILPNISRRKDNQTMAFSQLIKRNMKNIFLEKSYTKCSRETSPRPFSNKSKLTISLGQQPKILIAKIYLIVYPSRRLPQYIETNPSHRNHGRREKIKLNFYFHMSLFWDTTKKCENKNLT